MERAALTLEEGWETLELGVAKVKRILEGCSEQFTPEEYMNLHTTIYDLCARSAYDYPQQLYGKYKNVLEVYINSTVLPSIKGKHDEFLLKELAKRWCNHNLMLRCLKRFFQYLDQYHTYRRGIPTLYAVGMTCFRDLVYEKVKGKAKDAINALIEKEREGEQINRALLKNVLDIFVKLGMGKMDLYEDDFEKHMLQETSAYYSRKAVNWIVEHSFPDYMIKYEECLVKEKERVSCYLQSSTEPKLVENVQNELLVAYTTQLLEKEHSGVHVLLRDDKEEDLSRMYRLFQKITPGLNHVANAFKKHVTSEGMVLIKQAEEAATAASSQAAGSAAVVQDQVLVRKILDLHDKYLAYVSGCFQNHTLLYKAMKEAFEVFCNKTVAGGSSAELLATFCDNILKKGGNEKPSDEAIEETLEKAVKLLVYINHKDLFAEVHRKKLARRLLIDGGANDEHERSILTRLKQQCGGQFTSKMEGMVTDMTLATENQTSFEKYIGENAQAHPGIDLCVTVLTTGFWPTYKSSDLNLPVEMVKGIQAFKEFYDQRSKRRKLNWIYSLGSCNIIGRFEQKPIELIVSTYQAVILLLFNNSDKLSYSEIMARSNVSHEDLLRLLHSLSCSKYKILNKDRNTKTISQTDTFEFNSKFTDRMRRIKIPLASMHERTKVLEDVDEDRRYAIDAAVVRVMKSRKVLPHQRLVSECVKQLNHMFKPDKRSIKKRIEDLVTRDYLERDRENPNVFKYLA